MQNSMAELSRIYRSRTNSQTAEETFMHSLNSISRSHNHFNPLTTRMIIFPVAFSTHSLLKY